MGSNTIGKLFTFTTFGESHGEALGCIVEGFPSNFELDLEKLQKEMDRRRPGSTNLGTNRNEGDRIEILSGLFEGKTTGAPIMMLVRNTNQKTKDYSAIKNVYRPGHADYTFSSKYGIRDYRGGGRSSARETLARVAAGALAKQYLEKEGIHISAAVVGVGDVCASEYIWNPPFKAPLYAPDCKEYPMMVEKIEEMATQLELFSNAASMVLKQVLETLFLISLTRFWQEQCSQLALSKALKSEVASLLQKAWAASIMTKWQYVMANHLSFQIMQVAFWAEFQMECQLR